MLPLTSDLNFRAYNHLLGECGTIIAATAKHAVRYRRKFPKCLDGAPIFLPDRQHSASTNAC